jgi:hypothetical protein
MQCIYYLLLLLGWLAFGTSEAINNQIRFV